MKKTICFVSDSFITDPTATITGPMVQTYLIGKGLHARGWEVHYLAAHRENRTGTEMYEGMTVHWMRQRKFFQFLDYFLFMRSLKAVNADHHYQRGREVFTGFVARYCRTHSKRFVWASSGETGVEREKYVKQFRKKKSPVSYESCIWMEAKINDRICEYGIRNASGIIVQTETQRALLKDQFGLDSAVIRSGHPIPARAERSLPFKVLWIGSIKPVKRPELFIRLASMCAHVNCEFWMAGQSADKKLTDAVLTAAKELRNLKYLGAVPFKESQSVISGAHVLVNTTEEGYEGLPNAFVQAWLAGTVTLSLHADPDGVIEAYGLGKKAETLDEMKTLLQQMTDDPGSWTAYSRNVEEFGREHVSIARTTDRIEKILTD